MVVSSNNALFIKHYTIFIADGANIIELTLLYILYIEWYSNFKIHLISDLPCFKESPTHSQFRVSEFSA